MSENFPDDPEELYEKAEEFIDRDDFLKASECLNKALEIDPNYTEAMMKLGYVHMRLEFKKLSIDHIFIKDEQVLWYNSYETNLLRKGLNILYYGLICAIFFIIFGTFFTIQFGTSFLIYFIFAFPGFFYVLRGYLKIVKINNTLESIPDDPRQYKEFFIFTNKRWIQKSSICMGIKPSKSLLSNHPSALYELFKNSITEYEIIDMFSRKDDIIFIDLKHIELRYEEHPKEGWNDNLIYMSIYLKINDDEYILLTEGVERKKQFKKVVKDMENNITSVIEPTEDECGIINFR